jgi:Fur family ferric uptake transcriptional regulator
MPYTAPDSHSPAPATRSRLRAACEAGDAAADLLRTAGLRPTPQRLLVLQALGEGDHVTADAVLAHARAAAPTVVPSTVYRALDALVEARLVRVSDLGAGRLHYEIAREHRHHHLVCQACGAIGHIHDAALGGLEGAVLRATGWRLTPDREMALPALCPGCLPAPRRVT